MNNSSNILSFWPHLAYDVSENTILPISFKQLGPLQSTAGGHRTHTRVPVPAPRGKQPGDEVDAQPAHARRPGLH